MSKVALVALCRSLAGAGVGLLDVQFVTSHLRSLGAVDLPRAEYLRRLAVERDRVVDLHGLVPTLYPPAAPP
jgi:leucyl/phenylalanyl-tRNA---protein transferase